MDEVLRILTSGVERALATGLAHAPERGGGESAGARIGERGGEGAHWFVALVDLYSRNLQGVDFIMLSVFLLATCPPAASVPENVLFQNAEASIEAVQIQ